jgi:hypothetical protein
MGFYSGHTPSAAVERQFPGLIFVFIEKQFCNLIGQLIAALIQLWGHESETF